MNIQRPHFLNSLNPIVSTTHTSFRNDEKRDAFTLAPKKYSSRFPLSSLSSQQRAHDFIEATGTLRDVILEHGVIDPETLHYSGRVSTNITINDLDKTIAVLTLASGNERTFEKIIPSFKSSTVSRNIDGSISYYVNHKGFVDLVIGYCVKYKITRYPDGRTVVSWLRAGVIPPKPTWAPTLSSCTSFTRNSGSFTFTPLDNSKYKVTLEVDTEPHFYSAFTQSMAKSASGTISSNTGQELRLTLLNLKNWCES